MDYREEIDKAKEYIRDNDRTDVLCKPLADGSVALSFINVSTAERFDKISITAKQICECIGNKMTDVSTFTGASSYELKDLWSHILTAYRMSDVDELENLELLVHKVMTERGAETFVVVCTDIESRIERVERYERLFDEATRSPDPEKLRCLDAYYTSGEWQEDYEADERGELPPDLKRGVLSQDALFDLLER